MKQKLSTGVVVAVIALAVVVAAYYGWRTVSGGPNADITQYKIQEYTEQQKKLLQAHKFTSSQEAAKTGAPMGSATGAPMSIPGRTPTGGPPPGAPMGGASQAGSGGR